ncbi:TetR/AcrR family transcriptional regulator [Metapseudomonas otitidis]|uniref:TetR/AcrR family transcriptional regulator n=1 Tax=Metapseudomonas otitidis TaxID=319939 RepID=UPI001AAFB30E|nr:TetR/AcrR family transcriptional regulator [Pseudomonas otitidis]MBO2927683.1 TetR/AcrR family transcriptional regulator [Pseudomonas otitidis]
MSDPSAASPPSIKRPPIDVLQKVLADVLEHGFAYRSLRAIAETSGISHRMLIYHFGSQDGVWAAIIEHARSTEQAAFAEGSEAVQCPATLRTFLDGLWQRYSSAEALRFYQLHIEVYGYALRHREAAGAFLDGVVTGWLERLQQVFQRAGFDLPAARQRTRLLLAATRGFHLDLLTTGDREGVEAAVTAMLEAVTAP